MGLFGKKDPCAICGGKVKGLLPWKIDGQLVCNDCYGHVDLPQNAVNFMSLEDFRGYMAFREENRMLKDQFRVTDQVDFGWLDDKFLFDMNNGLLCMDKNLNDTIFEARQIKSFTIREDASLLFQGSASGLVCQASTVPDRIAAMEPQIMQYKMMEQRARNVERVIDMMDGDRDNNTNHYRRTIDIPEPFQKFIVEIRFDHPYWNVYTADMGGPTFNNSFPDTGDYMRVYNDRVAIMEQLARTLMALAFPGAPEQYLQPMAASVGGYTTYTPVNTPTTANVDAVAEIQRFKSLMEQGIITEEEFAAKKRQLLGI